MAEVMQRIHFRGQYYEFTPDDIKDLQYFQSDGETLEQTLERIYIEREEDRRLERLKNAGTLDYYIHIFPKADLIPPQP